MSYSVTKQGDEENNFLRCLGGAYYVYLQDRRVSKARNELEAKMEAICCSGTTVDFNRTV
jgi:hypothetical protein